MCRYAEIIRKEAPTLRDGVAFQSIAVASFQTLKKVLAHQRRAADAAISLAQGEKLTQMIDDSEATAEAIVGILNAQGSHILNLAPSEVKQSGGENSWWFALAEVLQTLEDGTTRIVSLASGQPKGGPARRLSSIVVRLLRTHHHALMSEAEEWIS